MFNIFQQPWVLLIVSFVLLVIVYIIRTSYPEKERWWFLLIPVFAVILAFGLDYLVKTDHEKVKGVLEDIITATMNKDVDAIDELIAEDYHDRHHPTKQSIMNTCKFVVARHNIKSITMAQRNIIIDGPEANVELSVILRMDTSKTAMPTPELNSAKLKLTITKKTDQSWVIQSTQLVEVNKNPVNWSRAN